MHVIERGSGTPIVLVHGFGVDHRILLPLDATIEAAGAWRRIYVDLPGHGESPIGDVGSTMDVVAAVEQAILDRVHGERFAMIGNSFGGMVSRYIAHRLQDRVLGLGTIGSPFFAASDRRTLPDRVVLTRDDTIVGSLGDAGASYADMAVIQSPANAASFVDHVYPGIVAADEAAMERIAANYEFPAEPEDAWPAPFARPCLFIAGRQDQVAGYRDALSRVEHYPRATFAALDAAGHNVHLDQPAVTAALVTDWLGRVAADAAS